MLQLVQLPQWSFFTVKNLMKFSNGFYLFIFLHKIIILLRWSRTFKTLINLTITFALTHVLGPANQFQSSTAGFIKAKRFFAPAQNNLTHFETFLCFFAHFNFYFFLLFYKSNQMKMFSMGHRQPKSSSSSSHTC